MAKAELETNPGDSRDLLNEIRSLIEDARRQTAAAVNVGLTALYWRIENRILREVLGSNLR
jgi:hypothetical protein